MRKVNLLSSAIVLALSTQVTVAADYLLDASTLSVGSTVGENLTVKEGCLDTTKTSCTEKYKWLTATSAIKIGNLQVVGELKGNFEIIVTLDAGGDPKSIKLLTTDNKGISLSVKYVNGDWVLESNGVGTGSAYGFSGWKGGDAFNELKLTVQQGATESIVKAYINGVPFNDSSSVVKFDKAQVFSRVAFEGFTTNDRLIDIKIRGISTVSSCTGGSSTTTPVSGTTNTGNLPQISANMDITIPRGLYSQSAGIFTPAGSIPIWANLKYVPQGGQHFWTLTNAGVLP
ncbi:MAG: hypothetical protein RL368_2190 [Pseudomonadota bacterium]|jgi:hypothetical protein